MVKRDKQRPPRPTHYYYTDSPPNHPAQEANHRAQTLKAKGKAKIIAEGISFQASSSKVQANIWGNEKQEKKPFKASILRHDTVQKTKSAHQGFSLQGNIARLERTEQQTKPLNKAVLTTNEAPACLLDKGKAPSLDKGRSPFRAYKPQEATFEWQTVSPKNKSQKRQERDELPSMLFKVKIERKCFNCLQVGHYKASCRNVIKCLNCGKFGHKYASCFKLKPKPTHIVNHQQQVIPVKVFSQPSQPVTYPPSKQPKQQTLPSKMEPFFHERPAVGDDFNPERDHLNANNAYMASTGMVIILQGAITADLPDHIVDCLAYVHNRPLQAYQILPAQISPFLVICPDHETRDTAVSGGVYKIPSRIIRFRVTEWRPRFGMASDPLTHQTWVRLVGLPLQAWTYDEIRRFVLSFGMPIRVLPFGRATGHFNYVEVLIGSKHPRQIPLAKRYREGDHSTMVDIRITRWREWAEGPFFPNNEDDLPPHQQKPRRDPPPPPPRNPSPSPDSSSSSDGGTYFSANWSAHSPPNWQLRTNSKKLTARISHKPVQTKIWKVK